MDPIGATASLIAIAGLAANITYKLDQMIQRYHDAPAVFGAFRTNFDSARQILATLSETLQSFKVKESRGGLDFPAHLRDAMTAIKATLDNVWDRLALVRQLRRPNPWRVWEKLMVVWDEEQLDKWDKLLSRQVTNLNTLLTAQTHYWAHAKESDEGGEGSANMPTPPESRPPTPPSDDEGTVVDHNGSLGVQAKVEKALDAVTALPTSQADGKMKSMTVTADVAQRALDSLKLRAGALVEGHPDLKFRILLMGKQGNGKTTLCNKVLGIKLKGSIFGDSTSFDNVHKEQTFDGTNPDLIIHDAGGFENGSSEATAALRSFLEERSPETADVHQRIHCIWYVIACNGSKPIHPIDEQFLENHFGIANIPVFIVLTKYDEIINAFKLDEPGASDKDIEVMAYNEFKRRTLDPLRALVHTAQKKHRMNVEICTVGLRRRGPEFQPEHTKSAGVKHWGSTQLVSLMRANLSEELRPLLAAVQVADPRNKLSEAVEACTKLYWSAIIVKTVPILPLLTVGSLATVYMLTLKKAQRIWKLTTEPGFRISSREAQLTNLIVKAIFNIKTTTGLAFLSAARAADVVSVVAASKLARDLVTIVVGLNVLLHDLWLVQHGGGGGDDDGAGRGEPLCLEQVQKVCAEFQASDRRRAMAKEIDKINLWNMYRKKEVVAIADRAWRASLGEELASTRKTERQNRAYMAQFDAANPV